MGWDAIITAAGNLGGAGIQAGANKAAQRRAMWYNAGEAHNARSFISDQADIDRDWKKMMSDTSYRRASADMTKAGLNPMMMYGSGGSPGSVPGGSSGGSAQASSQAQSHSAPDLGRAITAGMATAREGKRVKAQIDNLNENTNLTKEKVNTEKTLQNKNLRDKSNKFGTIDANIKSLKQLIRDNKVGVSSAWKSAKGWFSDKKKKLQAWEDKPLGKRTKK